MGTSGPAIFSDDLACDIRSEFRELIGDGLSPQEATDKIIADYTKSGIPTDPDEGPTFWIALAATQWKCGRLIDSVKERALASIESDLQRWHDGSRDRDPNAIAKLVGARRKALDAFRQMIVSPQPAARKIPKLFRDRTEWDIGHFVTYTLNSGRLVVFRITGIDDGNKHRIALGEMCDWLGDKLPSMKTLVSAPRKRTKYFDSTNPFERKHDGKMMLCSMGPRDFPAQRLRVIATGQSVEITDSIGVMHFGGWKRLDAYLKSYFDIE